MLKRLINATKTTFFIKNDNFLLKIKNSSQYVLQFLYKNDFVLSFRKACKELEISQSDVIRKAMEDTIKKWKGGK